MAEAFVTVAGRPVGLDDRPWVGVKTTCRGSSPDEPPAVNVCEAALSANQQVDDERANESEAE